MLELLSNLFDLLRARRRADVPEPATERGKLEFRLWRLGWFPARIEGGEFLVKVDFYGPGTFALVGTPGENYDPAKPITVDDVHHHKTSWASIADDDLAAYAEAVCKHEESRG